MTLLLTISVMAILMWASVFIIISGLIDEPNPRTKALGGCITATAMLVAIAVYAAIGEYGKPDAPLSGRVAEIREARTQEQADRAITIENLERARTAVRANPDDIRARFALAAAAAEAGDFALEISTLEAILGLFGNDAEGGNPFDTAPVKSLIAEALSREAGGLVTARALGWVEAALTDDPDDIRARYLRGLYFSQSGDDNTALNYWAPLAGDVAGTDLYPPVARAINAAATRLGVDAADFLPGDSAVSDADISNMVTGLEDRLLALDYINDHEDWEMLIRSHAVLGNTAQRNARIGDLLARMEGPSVDPVSDSRLLMAVVQIILPADNLPATIPQVVEPLLARARDLTPDAPTVLFFSGLVAHHGGDATGARRYWEPLVIRLEDGDRLRTAIEKELANGSENENGNESAGEAQ